MGFQVGGDGFDTVDYCASGADSDLWGERGGELASETGGFPQRKARGFSILTKRMSDVKWSSTALKAALRLALSTADSSGGGALVAMSVE